MLVNRAAILARISVLPYKSTICQTNFVSAVANASIPFMGRGRHTVQGLGPRKQAWTWSLPSYIQYGGRDQHTCFADPFPNTRPPGGIKEANRAGPRCCIILPARRFRPLSCIRARPPLFFYLVSIQLGAQRRVQLFSTRSV